MPPIASKKQVIDGLYGRVRRSVVTIERHIGNELVGFGSGFIVVSDQDQVLVSVHESIVKDGEKLHVRYYTDELHEATVFLTNTASKHVILKLSPLPRHRRQHVTFSEKIVRRQNIFTIAAVEEFGDCGLMTGTISNRNCEAVARSNTAIVRGSKNLFAISCPAAGPKTRGQSNGEDLQLVGAAVFDMNGLVIGSVDHVDLHAFDIKYAMKTSSFLNDLERLLKDMDDKIVLSKDQQGFNKAAGTRKQGGSTVGSSRKRHRDDPPGGGTRTKGDLCTDQLKAHLEVSREENLRSHKYPVQGDMVVGRKEALRRELIKHVTRESDDGWPGPLSSPGDRAALHAFSEALGSAVSPDFGAGAGTLDARFGKENVGDSAAVL
ncbi:hypothetical protein ACQJBY_020955 [Aegilops geniculata]